MLLREYEERFTRLSVLDRTVLDTSRVLLFVKFVDVQDREQVGILLDTDEGLATLSINDAIGSTKTRRG